MEKWICKKCGREIFEKPHKNQLCKLNGCKGRYKHYSQCECGKLFEITHNDKKYCSLECRRKSKQSKINTPIELKCANCNKEFTRAYSNIKKNTKNSFCSINCKKEFWAKNRVKRICLQCEKEFVIPKSVISGKTNSSANFCCRSCYNEYQKSLVGERNKSYKRIAKECPNCGKELKVIPAKAKEYKNNFCSIQCKNEYMYNYIGGEQNCNWKGERPSYRGDFEHIKTLYFKETKKCAVCGTHQKIHIHHIIPYKLTQDNSLDNLIPLCARHHRIIECKTVKMLDGRKDYENAKRELKTMIGEISVGSYQSEVV